MQVYKVGGAVRDLLMGHESKDIDYSVVAKSYDEMKEYILNKGCQIYQERPEYATIRARYGNEDVDFVLCRKDGFYSDSRRPDSIEIGSLMDDLSRRDFTMNAIAIDEAGNYHDPFNGWKDIENRIIRCVGSVERLREDPLRMMRALRFSITKRMLLDDDITDFIYNHDNWDLLYKVSEERISTELNKCLEKSSLETLFILLNHFGSFGSFFLGMLDERGILLSSKFYPARKHV